MNEDAKRSRETRGSRFGFLMAMIGAMVGAGNIWCFPYIVGENGGGTFIIAYLIILTVLAVPGLTAEVSPGRFANQGVIRKLLGDPQKLGSILLFLVGGRN